MTALISECGKYRYSLERLVGTEEERRGVALRTVLWVMLNPSTADARKDDPTIRKCMSFSARWGFTHMLVGNLFAWRATDPAELPKAQLQGHDIVGPRANEVLINMAQRAELVVCAWGAQAERWPHRSLWVRREIAKVNPVTMALKITNSGEPYHPLYLPLELEPQPWAP